MPHGQRIAEFLLDIGAVQLNVDDPFTWTSGLKSPVYCDNRMIYSHPDARGYIVNALINRIKTLHIEPDFIAGTATAAIGWAALTADRMNLPFVYVRSKPKEHGAKKQIEGDLSPGKDIVVVEDLFSTGGSAMNTVNALRTEGEGHVSDVVGIFTYEFLSSREKAMEAGVKLHPLATLTTLLSVAKDRGAISEEGMREIARFIENPETWGTGN